MACNRYDESDRKFIEELVHMHVRYLSEDFTLQEAFERTSPQGLFYLLKALKEIENEDNDK